MALNYGTIVIRNVRNTQELRRCLEDNAFLDDELLSQFEPRFDVFATEVEARSELDLIEGPHLVAVRFRVGAEGSFDAIRTSLQDARNKRNAFLAECAPWNRESRTMTCKSCRSVIDLYSFMQYCGRDGSNLMAHVCPTCGAWIMSPTNKKRLAVLDSEVYKYETMLQSVKYGPPTDELAWLVSYGAYY